MKQCQGRVAHATCSRRAKPSRAERQTQSITNRIAQAAVSDGNEAQVAAHQSSQVRRAGAHSRSPTLSAVTNVRCVMSENGNVKHRVRESERLQALKESGP